MKKYILKTLAILALFGLGLVSANQVNAEGEPKVSLTLTPVSQILDISSDSVYDGTMSVTNDGDEVLTIQVYASPYSYIYSEDIDGYQLAFNNETSFTQLTRWITIKDSSGNYVENPTFTIEAGATLIVEYRITTPSSLPAGGQYAVLFAQTVSGGTGIKTEANTGMVIYGRSTEGETLVTANINSVSLEQGTTITSESIDEETGETIVETETTNHIYASAKVANTGNVDFFARGTLTVVPIIGFTGYETPAEESSVSIIPESELLVSDEWEETPGFGIYKATWTVVANDQTETVERIFFIIPPYVIVLFILVLTIIIIGIIMVIKRRKVKRSRLTI